MVGPCPGHLASSQHTLPYVMKSQWSQRHNHLEPMNGYVCSGLLGSQHLLSKFFHDLPLLYLYGGSSQGHMATGWMRVGIRMELGCVGGRSTQMSPRPSLLWDEPGVTEKAWGCKYGTGDCGLGNVFAGTTTESQEVQQF